MKRVVGLASLLALGGCLAWAQQGGKGAVTSMVSAGPRGGGQPAPAPAAAPSRGGGWGGGNRWAGHGGRPSGGGFSRPPGVFVAPNPYYPRTYGSPHGYGNVVFPGTGSAPGTFSPFSVVDPTFGVRLANTVSGYGYGYGSGYYGGYNGYGYGQQVAVPYPVPVYVPYPEPQQPAQIVVPPPQVIYVVPGDPSRNLTTTAPPSQNQSVVTYVVPPRYETPPGESAKRLYLIAFKNHSIYSASEYWVEDETLHYVTPYGAHNQASLDQIDVEFTTRLNRERGIDFRLEKQQPQP